MESKSFLLPMLRKVHFSDFFALVLVSGLVAFLPQLSVAQAQPKRAIAITFDDLPMACMCETIGPRQELTDKLITSFKKYNVPVTAFVNEQ
jgi:peptidoglycan/xylan/chitin deacetylase (PgdA/CDA1 family)